MMVNMAFIPRPTPSYMMALEFLEPLRCCGNDIFVGCGDAR
jgi:hypothetical protein